MSIEEIREKVKLAPKGGARQLGEILLEICKVSEAAAELVAQDLEAPEMSIENCFAALYEFAKKNQTGGQWCCGGVSLDVKNPVIKAILDFYKIPSEWIGGTADEKPKRLGTGAAVNLFDLL